MVSLKPLKIHRSCTQLCKQSAHVTGNNLSLFRPLSLFVEKFEWYNKKARPTQNSKLTRFFQFRFFSRSYRGLKFRVNAGYLV